MQYQEKTIRRKWYAPWKKPGFEYYGAGVFGDMTVHSNKPLDGDKLDGIMGLLLKDGSKAQHVNGTIKVAEDHVVSYKFTKNLQWGEETVNVPKPCENTSTSTKEQKSESTQTKSSTAKSSNWFKRFVVAFREAWKSTKE